jgi:8-oxo-dGTP diphosphatase
LYVVRHAAAGSRSAWTGDDRLRPLSKKGRRQAAELAELLADAGLERLVSSSYVRCIQTLEPLAERTGSEVEIDDRLAEGSDGAAALQLAEELRDAGVRAAALCSHGDVVPELLSLLKVTGTAFHQPLVWPKGSVWALNSNGTHWTDAELLTRA